MLWAPTVWNRAPDYWTNNWDWHVIGHYYYLFASAKRDNCHSTSHGWSNHQLHAAHKARGVSPTVPGKQSSWGRAQPPAGRGGGGTAAAAAVVAAAAVLSAACFQAVAMAGFGTCLVVLVLLSSSSAAVQLLFSTKWEQKEEKCISCMEIRLLQHLFSN